jgi:hypothetical protein
MKYFYIIITVIIIWIAYGAYKEALYFIKMEQKGEQFNAQN